MSRLGRLLAAAAALALSGCATAYRSEATPLSDGGFQSDGPGHLVRVGFAGNGFISARNVRRYALFRAAEYADSQHKPYFLLYPTLLDAAKDAPGAEPSVGMVGGKPRAIAYLLLLDQKEPQALETAALLEELARTEGARGPAGRSQ
jgi:hypothetical protein